jgi:tetratricopeptide (TPR) repeat protein
MIKKYIVGIATVVFVAACGSADVSREVNSANSAEEPIRTGRVQSTIEHTTENRPANASSKRGAWSATGTPIDVSEFDKAIADADKRLNSSPNDEKAKAAAAEAYYKRAMALTEAQQYASALGDFRRVLKHDPEHEQARFWEKEITRIYQGMGKEYPKPGEEPTPLPFKNA